MRKASDALDQRLFETVIHTIGDWLDERHLELSGDKYFELAQLLYDRHCPDSSVPKEEREEQMRKVYREQFFIVDSFAERQRQSDINVFQRIAQAAIIAATGALAALLVSSNLGAAPIARSAFGILLIGFAVNFIVIPMLRRVPHDKERVRKKP